MAEGGSPIDNPIHVTGLNNRLLYWILAAGLAARGGAVLVAQFRPDAFDFPDSRRYVQVARNIAAGLGPIDSAVQRAGTDPLYPALLALGPRLGLESDASILLLGRLWNVLFGVIGVGLVGMVATRIGRDLGVRGQTVAGAVAAGVAALDPISVYFTALVLTETVYSTLLISAIYALVRLADGATGRRGLLAGVCLGLGTAARSTGLLLPLILAPAAWALAESGRRRRAAAVGGLLAGAAVILAPTVIRNARLFGSFVPVRIGAGASLTEALGPWADGGPGMDRIIYPPFPAGADELQRDRICLSSALTWAREHPGRAASLAWAKLRRTWSVTPNAAEYRGRIYTLVCYATVVPVFVLAAVGAWRLRSRRAMTALLLAPAAYFTLIHMVFVGSVRYRLPAMTCLFVLAGLAAAGRSRQAASGQGPDGAGGARRG